MTAIVELKNATKIVNTGIEEEKVILNDVSLDIFEHDFITILGGNGAGKSTLFNVIAGTLPLTSGSIYILGENVTNYSPEKRAKYLSRVFQDPKMGTAPRMTVAENLLIAKFRGEKRRLVPRCLSHYRKEFQETIDKIGNGLEKHLDTPITHHMEDALKYGNRLIVMKDGQIIQDLHQEEKAKMTIADYYSLFE